MFGIHKLTDSPSHRLFFDIVWDERRSAAQVSGAHGDAPQATNISLCGTVPRRHHSMPAGAFPGGHRRGVTPVPIPNTEVKLSTADGTAWVTAWESRSLPGLFLRGRCQSAAFFCTTSRRRRFGFRRERLRPEVSAKREPRASGGGAP